MDLTILTDSFDFSTTITALLFIGSALMTTYVAIRAVKVITRSVNDSPINQTQINYQNSQKEYQENKRNGVGFF